jgi:endonuclease YncB( thermonuclease family)
MTAVWDANLMASDSSSGEWPYLYQATVVRVIDADTLCLAADLGFGIAHTLKVRLLGIDSPEMKTAEGLDARQFVVSWLEQHGGKVVVQTKKDRSDSFGRYLAYVSVGQHCLNDELLKAGHAKEYRK